MDMIETLQLNATKAKHDINEIFDEIIITANERRAELLNQIDTITKTNTQIIQSILNKQWHSNQIETQPFPSSTINVDMNVDHLIKVLRTIGPINNYYGEQQYIKKLKHGLEADLLLFSGYIRGLTKETKMQTSQDAENLCFQYSLNANISEQNKQRQKNEVKFNDLCHKMKQILGYEVTDVIIDGFPDRQDDFPFRIIDHALKETYLRKPTIVTVAINPSNIIITTLYDRFKADPKDKVVRDLVPLLYETHLTQCDLPLPNPQSLCRKVHSLVKIGLGIDEDSSSDDEHTSSSAYDGDVIRPKI